MFIDEKDPDLILVSGGDGALLHAIQDNNFYKVPFFGYAAGTLNFLMNQINFKDTEKFIVDLKNNKIELNQLKTTKIEVELYKSKINKKLKIGEAVNEVVLGTSIMGYHSFLVNSNDGVFKEFDIKGSGICISTDLGSTGYNFNLGGSVLPLGNPIWSMVGIVCNRFLEDIISIKKITVENTSKRYPSYNIFIDGIKSAVKVEKGDKVYISKGEPVKIAFINKDSFFEKRIDISSRFRKY